MIFAAFALASCEKVIEPNLRNAAPVTVVEASLELGKSCNVKLTRTRGVGETNASMPVPVSGATVTLSSDHGENDTLPEITHEGHVFDGLYSSVLGTIEGQAGREYTLTITEMSGRKYVARATMPEPVALDSIRLDNLFSTPHERFFQVIPYFQDPAGTDNYYLFEVYVNGARNERFNVRSDRFSDGQYNKRGMFVTATGRVDSVRLEMFGLDKGAHGYYSTLGDANGSVTPANPISNFSGGCLGCFRVCTRQTKMMEISHVQPATY
jgi:hypothetical protein